MRGAVTSLLLVAALLLPACTATPGPTDSAPDEPRAPAREPGDFSDDPRSDRVDLGERYFYGAIGGTVSYPTGWSRRSGDLSPSASYFDPYPIESTKAQSIPVPRLAVHLDVDPKPLEDAVATVDERTVLERHEVAVAGLAGMRFETQSSGAAGGLPMGVRTYAYYIQLAGGGTLRAVTYQLTGLDYEQNKRVLDAMVRSLEFRREGE